MRSTVVVEDRSARTYGSGGPNVSAITASAPARSQPASRVVVDTLGGDRQARLGATRLRVPGGIAEVQEQDHRMRCETNLAGKERLAEVLVGHIVHAGDRVEPESVLRRRVERGPVRTGEAVAVPEIDDDRRPLQRTTSR